MVNLTRIYTRTGDAGETRLGDMSVTTKNDLRLKAYADVDEANAHIGVALSGPSFVVPFAFFSSSTFTRGSGTPFTVRLR